MSKKHKTLSDIQAALRSNTQFLGEEQNKVDTTQNTNEENGECSITVAEDLWQDLQLLAKYQQTTVEKLVHLAIEDLLSLRARILKAAKESQTGDEK
ncbi:MAG: hypothetical protein ACTTKZ_00865 [Bacteroides sp.]|jgi:hypothetical protein